MLSTEPDLGLELMALTSGPERKPKSRVRDRLSHRGALHRLCADPPRLMVTSCDSHFPFISENERTRKDRRYSLLRGWQIPDTPAVPSPLTPPGGRHRWSTLVFPTSPTVTSDPSWPCSQGRLPAELRFLPRCHLCHPLEGQTERLTFTRQGYFSKSHGPSTSSSVCSEMPPSSKPRGLADKCGFTSVGAHRLLFLALALISEAASAGSV